MTYALVCLIDPPTLAAVGLLLLNDHVLKATIPSWLTGKLSDVAGLYFFPFLVLAALGLLERMLPRYLRCPDRAMGFALVSSGLWFLVLKATPTSNTCAVALLKIVTGRAHQVVVDPTDLIALATLPLTWWRWQAVSRRWDQSPGRDPRQKRRLGLVALALASLAAMATTPLEPPVSFGGVFAVAANPENGDTLYATLFTQRILDWDPSENTVEAEYTAETFRSQDGGRTWTLYAPIGGYLWADPHTPDLLYAINEDGLHRIENGQARLLVVPFESAQIELFHYDYPQDVDVPPNPHPLAFDPIIPGVLYLADGERILASSDGGLTWRSLEAGDVPNRVTALAVAPSPSQTLYAAAGSRTGTAFILRSDDGGASWSHIVEVGEQIQLRALAVHPEAPDVVYAGGHGIFRSTDGGMTWHQIYESNADLRAIAFHPANPDLIYVAGPKTILSDDGGNTWHLYGRSSWDVAASPVMPNRVILALGNEGVAVQESLSMLPTPTPPLGLDPSNLPVVLYADALAVAPDDPATFYALVGDPPVLGCSDDGGARWAIHPLPSVTDDPPTVLTSRPVSPAGVLTPLVALGNQTAYHLTWQRDGVIVESFSLPEGTAVVSRSRPLLLDPVDPDLLLTAGSGGVLRSDDGGQTWTAGALSSTASLDWPTALVAAPSQPDTFYAVIDAGDGDPREQAVFRSGDGGITWQLRAQMSNDVHLVALAVHPADPDIIYGGGAGFYQSSDGGMTWIPIYPTLTVHTLAIDPDDSRFFYAITDEGVARSDDGGMTWATVCPSGQVNGPAEFLGIMFAPVEPHRVILLARPTRSDLDTLSAGVCLGSDTPRHDLSQGWQQFTESLPVFVESFEGKR